MEVEAKFRVDSSACRQLADMEHLAGYVLHPLGTRSVQDRYYDTFDQALRRHSYVLRLRHENEDSIATLKSLTRATDAGIHRREEHEQILPIETTDVASWPAGEVRTRVLHLTHGQPIGLLLSITQIRQKWRIMNKEQAIAELSCDTVEVATNGGTTEWHELEVELLAVGTDTPLDTIVDALRTQLDVTPESRSKYERGLELLG